MEKTQAVRDRFVRVNREVDARLFEPETAGDRAAIAVVCMHSDGNYLSFSAGPQLAARGYRVICANTGRHNILLDKKLEDVNAAVACERNLPGVNKVVLFGHSGGATLMSAFQCAAENGPDIFRGDEKVIKLSRIEPLAAADGIMLIDSNWGNGAMTLLSIDPAIIDETTGMKLDESLDIYNPDNGFDPTGSTYSDEFIERFLKAQGERNNRIIELARQRLAIIEKGEGLFEEDEPFVVPAASQIAPFNKLFPQDIRLLSHTRKEWPLLHKDGAETVGIVPSVRRPRGGRTMSRTLFSAEASTVRSYLTSRSVLTTPDYGYTDDTLHGVDWNSSYCCTPGNVQGIKAPLLAMGMTGGYEYLAAETIREMAGSADTTLAFVEGATHNFEPAADCEAFPGQFGDTVKTLYDYIAAWLSQGRFH